MALQISNINNLKESYALLSIAKSSYDNTLRDLANAVKNTELFWRGEDAFKFRRDLFEILTKNLLATTEEIDIEMKYLKKLSMVLENAQEQVKSKLNN